MRIMQSSFEVLFPEDKDDIYERIERIGRVCYKSEYKIEPGSAVRFVKMLMKRRHYAMLEHATVSVLWTVDRGVSHALVRHRVGAFAQESTIYCDYANARFGSQVGVIQPQFVSADAEGGEVQRIWEEACNYAESVYIRLRGLGKSPQEARSVLPTCLKTELVTTLNLREWMHFFEMRADPVDHPETVKVVTACLNHFKEWMPEIFEHVIPYSQQVIDRRN